MNDQRALQVERLKLGVQAKAFMEGELFVELKKRLVEHINFLNKEYWKSWEVDDHGKTTANLTGKRDGINLLLDILEDIFSQGETAVFEIEKNKLIEGHG